MQFQARRAQVALVIEQYIMHFPEFAFLPCCHGSFTCFHASLVNQCKREMTKIEADLAFIFLKQLLYHFVCLYTVIVLIFSEFHQGNRRIFFSYKNVFWFNDFFYFFFECHFKNSFLIAKGLLLWS